MKKYILALFTLAIFCSSCSEKQLTDTEYQAFCLKIDSCIRTGNSEQLSDALDVDALSSAALDSSDVGVIDKLQFKRGFKEKVSGFWQQISDEVRKGGSYHFMRLIKRDGRTMGLFRLFGEGGINYHEYHFSQKDGQPHVEDMYIYITGELLSQTLRTLVLSATIKSDGSLLSTDKFSTDKIGYVKKTTEMKRLAGEGRIDDAIEVYNSLDPEIKKMKIIQVVYLNICSRGEKDSLYDAAVDNYRKMYPGDPSLPLLLVDKYLIKQQYREAMQVVDELDKNVKDPYLDFMRGNVMYYMQKIDSAIYYMERTNKQVPGEIYNCYLSLYVLYANQEKYDKAIEAGKSMVKYFKKSKAEVEAETGRLMQPVTLVALENSEAYQAWK